MPEKDLNVFIRFNADLRNWASGMRTAAAQMKAVGDAAQQLNSHLRGLSLIATGGFTTIAGGLALIGREGLGVTKRVEDLNLALGVLLKSKSEAVKKTQEIVRLAAATPFESAGIAQFTVSLLSANVEIDKIIGKGDSLLKILGDAAAIMAGVKGMSPDQMLTEIAEVYKAVKGGMLQRERLTMIGVSPEEIAAQLGTKLSGQGELSQQFRGEPAANALLAVLKERFSGGQQEFSQTISGLGSTLSDAFKQAIKPVGEAIVPELKARMKELIAILDDPALMDGLATAARVAVEALKPLAEQGTGYLHRLLEYLKENPTALADAMETTTKAMRNLAIAIGVLLGAQGLLSLTTLVTGLASQFTILASVITGKVLPALRTLTVTGMLSGAIPALHKLGLGLSTLDFAAAASGALTLANALGTLAAKALSLLKIAGPLGVVLSIIYPQNKPDLDIGDLYRDIEKLIAEGGGGDIESAIGELEQLPGGELMAGTLRQKYLEKQAQRRKEAGFSSGGYAIGHSGDYESRLKGLPSGSSNPPPPGGDQEKKKPPTQEQLLLQQSEAQTLKTIGDLRGGKGKICVIKTREGVLALGGDTPEARAIYDALSGSDSVQSVTPKLAGATRQTVTPQVGDIIVLDRMGGPNTGSGGHIGFFLGYDDKGRVIMSGNSKGGKLTVGSEYGALQARAYDNSKGVWAYENPSSPVRRTMAQLGSLGQDDPLGKALASAREQLDALSAKLAFYREQLGRGALTQRQYDEVLQSVKQQYSRLYEALATTPEGQAVLAGLAPEQQALLRRSWEQEQRVGALEQLNEAVARATERFNQAAQAVLNLNDAISSITQAGYGLRAARARALGFTKEGDAIEGFGQLKLLEDQQAQIDRYKLLYGDQLASGDAARLSELRGLQQQQAQTATGLWGFIGGLPEKSALRGDLTARLDQLMPAIEQGLKEAYASASDQLYSAGTELRLAAAEQRQVAAAMLQAAGAVAAGAAAAAGQYAALKGDFPLGAAGDFNYGALGGFTTRAQGGFGAPGAMAGTAYGSPAYAAANAFGGQAVPLGYQRGVFDSFIATEECPGGT